MKKSLSTWFCAGLLTVGMAFAASAQDAKSNAAPAVPSVPAVTNSVAKTNVVKRAPFVGNVASVDKTAQSITLDGPKKLVVYVTAKTKISKDKQPATFDGITVGMRISGLRVETKPGHWEAASLNLNPPTPAKKAAAPAPAAKPAGN